MQLEKINSTIVIFPMDLNDDDLCLIQQAMEWAKVRIEQAGAEDIKNKDLRTRAWVCMRMVQLLASLPNMQGIPDDFGARVDALAKKCAPNIHRGSA
jgi:hypothetical protein